MSSGLKKHKRISPMPVTSSFPPPNRETCHSICVTRQMTPQEYTDMIEKYGPPNAPLSSRKPHSGMHEQRGKVKK